MQYHPEQGAHYQPFISRQKYCKNTEFWLLFAAVITQPNLTKQSVTVITQPSLTKTMSTSEATSNEHLAHALRYHPDGDGGTHRQALRVSVHPERFNLFRERGELQRRQRGRDHDHGHFHSSRLRGDDQRPTRWMSVSAANTHARRRESRHSSGSRGTATKLRGCTSRYPRAHRRLAARPELLSAGDRRPRDAGGPPRGRRRALLRITAAPAVGSAGAPVRPTARPPTAARWLPSHVAWTAEANSARCASSYRCSWIPR